MFEIIANIHLHTTYSDGSKNHTEIIKATQKSNIDVLFFTDHNIFLKGIEGYYGKKSRRVLVIMGEEIHDLNAIPQKNHLLALGTTRSFSEYSDHRQLLIEKIKSDGGVPIIAHPFDPAMPAFNEADISWEDWSVTDFTGIELWNGFSELKVRVTKKFEAYFYAFFPNFLPLSPPEKTIEKWNELLKKGKKVVVICGSDAHAIRFTAGPFNRIVFPYTFHLRSINNHILLKEELSGKAEKDKKQVIASIQSGVLFIGNDLIAPTRGFRFNIRGKGFQLQMGESRMLEKKMSMHISIPHNYAECKIFRDGKGLATFNNENEVDIKVKTKGIYRVECYKRYLGRQRGWIYSNPIYIR